MRRCGRSCWWLDPVGRSRALGYTGAMDEEQTIRRIAIWFIGILVAFKLWTVLLIVIYSSTWETVQFLVANHVLWFTVGAALVWGPALFWVRLMRLRAQRRELIRSEWEVEDSHKLYR